MLAVRWLVLLCISAASGAVLTAPGNAIALHADAQQYNISIGGQPWFRSATDSGQCSGFRSCTGYAFSSGGRTYSSAGGDLIPIGAPASGSGVDSTGSYSSLTLSWTTNHSTDETLRDEPLWITQFKLYEGTNALVFKQSWPRGHSHTVCDLTAVL